MRHHCESCGLVLGLLTAVPQHAEQSPHWKPRPVEGWWYRSVLGRWSSVRPIADRLPWSIYLLYSIVYDPSIDLSSYPSVHLSIYLASYPSIHLSIHPSIHLSIYYLSIYLSLFAYQSTFSTSQISIVIRCWGAFSILTLKCASRHSSVQFVHLSYSIIRPDVSAPAALASLLFDPLRPQHQ